MDQLADAGLSGGPGDLLGDADEHVFKAVVTGGNTPKVRGQLV